MPDHFITRDGVRLFVRESGVAHRIAAPVVFLHALGTDHRLWDDVLPLLPDTLRLIAVDMRGHGKSDVPPAPYTMGALISDVEAVCAALDVKQAVFVGLSIGGMIAQGLAVKRLDLVRGLVLSNTAARIATPQIWEDRIAAVRAGGVEAVADATVARWFHRDFRESPAARDWDARLRACPVEGWCGGAAAIAGTDFYTPTSGLRLPTLGIAGSEDGSTPPDLVRETVDLIPGARFHLMRRSGHLPCVDAPEAYAAALTGFLTEIGHG
ncbi:MAG: 3-oxoadipate enol-lactonase [Limimaricola sp.]|uniref:3-oxoadipate enol-lactonase n=1 Tax=Limimaricola sp. TaxID=2211665 RepID=UPI001E0A30D9|nr:3-oxoadipate enol-lactonase [Limimaricola sp.]MBI1415903.1 3-oxoadipate enol-lactonase [Limimaricola sp.]